MAERVACIGLGTMGKPMARNLLRAGFEVAAFNRSRPAVDELAGEGAAPAGSAAEAAKGAAFVVINVPDSPDVESVVNQVKPSLADGCIVIDNSTISPAAARSIAEELRGMGVYFLDAPVSGGQKGAIEGTLSIMVGGDESAFDRAMPIFQALGRNIVYMGTSGSGQLAKLCNQVLCGLNLLAVSEALSLGAKAGLDMQKLLLAISAGSGASWMLSNLGPKMLSGDFRPGFKVKLQQKDLRLALEAAAEEMLPLPGTALVHQIFRIVEAAGAGEEGTQAIIKAMELMGEFRSFKS